MSKLDSGDTELMREMYEVGLLSCGEIGEKLGVTRVRVWQVLKAAGVDTRKRKRAVKCGWCGKEFERTRKRVRESRNMYCSHECYMRQVSNPKYQADRQGNRVAVATVKKCFMLEPGMVVHHRDGDCLNNEIENLMVFRSGSDHMTFHRSSVPVEAWSGESREWEMVVNGKYGARVEE